MSNKRDTGQAADNVVILPTSVQPSAPVKEAKPSAMASASLAETTRRKEIARVVEARLSVKTAMDFSDRIALARNVRNYVYGLEAAGRLSVRQIGARAFDREEVRALQLYVLPKNVETQAEYGAKHPKRELAGKPVRYLAVMLAAAEIAGDDRNTAVLALAKGTRFWPGAEHAADDERRAANEIIELLAQIPAHLDRTYPLRGYFDLIESQRVLPRSRHGGVEFDSVDEFGWWEHEAMPSVPLATRWLEPYSVPVMVAVSKFPAPSEGGRIDFDALHESRRSFEAWVSRRQIFSLGIGRIAEVIGPVAIFSHEIILPNGQGYRVADRQPVDRFGPGWKRCTVDLGNGPLLAAWQLKEALDDPLDPDEQDYDQPPDVRIKPITADWLLEQRDVGWLIPKTTGFAAGMWQVLAQIGRGRIGAAEALPSIIERCLMAQTANEGPLTEISGRYTTFAQALKEWRALLDERAQRRLGQVAARLAGRPDPDEDRLTHLD